MLVGLRQDLVQGRAFPLTLIFSRAGDVTVTARVRRKVDASGITLAVDVQSDRKVYANFTEVEQVTLNFVINAQQSIESPDRSRGRILIRVVDAGKRVRLIRLNSVFTPGGRFRQFIDWHGKRVNARQKDGVHLSVAGASIAARSNRSSAPAAASRSLSSSTTSSSPTSTANPSASRTSAAPATLSRSRGRSAGLMGATRYCSSCRSRAAPTPSR